MLENLLKFDIINIRKIYISSAQHNRNRLSQQADHKIELKWICIRGRNLRANLRDERKLLQFLRNRLDIPRQN